MLLEILFGLFTACLISSHGPHKNRVLFDYYRMCRALCDGEYQAAIYDMVVLPEYQGKGMFGRLRDKLSAEYIILYSIPGRKDFT